jgi:hypothetical protein
MILTVPAQPTSGQSVVSLPSGSTGNVSAALQVITTYIPTETLTLYVAALAALRDAPPPAVDARYVSWSFIAATPIVVWLVYAARLKASGGGRALPLRPATWPLWEMVAATAAFTAWASALPESPFVGAGVTPAIGGIFVLVTSTLLGLAAPIFQRPLKG